MGARASRAVRQVHARAAVALSWACDCCCFSEVVLALACNKMDLPAERRVVTQQQAQAAAAAIGCALCVRAARPSLFPCHNLCMYETSAVSNEGVDAMFFTLAQSMAQAAAVRSSCACCLVAPLAQLPHPPPSPLARCAQLQEWRRRGGGGGVGPLLLTATWKAAGWSLVRAALPAEGQRAHTDMCFAGMIRTKLRFILLTCNEPDRE
jgi:hypothetical protein